MKSILESIFDDDDIITNADNTIVVDWIYNHVNQALYSKKLISDIVSIHNDKVTFNMGFSELYINCAGDVVPFQIDKILFSSDWNEITFANFIEDNWMPEEVIKGELKLIITNKYKKLKNINKLPKSVYNLRIYTEGVKSIEKLPDIVDGTLYISGSGLTNIEYWPKQIGSLFLMDITGKLNILSININSFDMYNCKGDITIENITSNAVNGIDITDCPGIKSIGNIYAKNARSINIDNCKNLAHLGTVTPIEKLHITKCPKLQDY